jgi:microcystin-dependent protein
MSQGQGPGLTLRDLGEVGGSANVTLLTTEMPAHAHGVVGQQAQADATSPANNFVAVNRNLFPYTAPNAPGLQLQTMSPQAVAPTGGSQPHNNMQPYLGLLFIIALQGVFPSRN